MPLDRHLVQDLPHRRVPRLPYDPVLGLLFVKHMAMGEVSAIQAIPNLLSMRSNLNLQSLPTQWGIWRQT